MDQPLSDLESRLTQCQEQIADVNTKMAMLMKERVEIDRRLRKLEVKVSMQLMRLSTKLWAH